MSATAPQLGTIRGHITDPSGALIPGAQVTVSAARGGVAHTVSADAAGAYVVKGLEPGSYVVQATFTGFAPFVSAPIAIEAGQSKSVNIKMAIETTQQQVEVSSDEGPTVSTEADANANTIVIKGKDLDALSDDPDELSNELQALAGPSAGPNGGQIYIDGFTGGQLPPKSAIREIRINQNPFSAEFDKLGYGRIEILTKPGTDQLHGRFFSLGNDRPFNTGNPFTKQIPDYHSIMGEGSLSGSLSKSASFFLSVEQRNSQDASIYTANTAALSGGTYVPTVISGGLFAPSTRTEISPRFDFQLGQKNTLTFRYQYYRSHSSGSIGATSLPEQNKTSNYVNHRFQVSDSTIISDHVVNELRLEFERGTSTSTPDSTAPTITVPSDFTSGGSSSQIANSHSDHYELQNFVTVAAGAHAIKLGAWLRDNREAITTNANFNGTFNFPSVDAYIDTLNGMQNGLTVAQIASACPTPGACTPNKLSYTTGPTSFQANVFDAALFFQDDWKFNQFLTLSGGLRWEGQNHTADHNDWAPRVAFAYALDGHKDRKQAKTVLRGGFGFFYDRFGVGSLMGIEQHNGTANSQQQYVITDPTCFSADSLNDALSQDPANNNCGAGSASTPQINTITPSYHAPYAEQGGLSLERQLTKGATLTLTYLHSFGVHQLVVRNANPYTPETGTTFYNSTTGPRLLASQGITGPVDQYFPQAVYKQNQLIVNVNAQLSQRFGIAGFYNWTTAKSNGGNGSNPTNSLNLNQDYGRATFIRPQMVFLMGNYSGPWGLTFNPFLFAEAGKPYTITTATDLTGDNFFNSRPAYSHASPTTPNIVQTTSFGTLNTDPQAGAALVPTGVGTGPAAVSFNLRLSRSFGLGPKVESAGGSPSGGPSSHHSHGGGFGNPFSSSGGGGHFHGGMSGTGRKYSLTFSAQALNLFNDMNYGTPTATIIPTLNTSTGQYGPGNTFGKSNHLASGMFASPSGSASRRIYFQAFFNF